MSFFSELPEEDTLAKVYNIKCKAFLLTYNKVNVKTYEGMIVFLDEIKKKSDCERRYSICLEEYKEEGKEGNHIHLYIHSGKTVKCQLSYFDVGDNKVSDCQPNTTKGSGYYNAMHRGHFYVQCKHKLGHLYEFSDFVANQDFTIKPEWIMSLWRKEKLANPIESLTHYKCITPRLEQEIECWNNKQSNKHEKLSKRRKILDGKMMPFKEFAIVEEWKEQYNDILYRYKFLIIFGPSDLGKTLYAMSLFKNPYRHKQVIDWSKYDDETHDCIIFDDIPNFYDWVIQNKITMQANDIITINTSTTMCYAKEIYLADKPMIALLNDPPPDNSEWIFANSVIFQLNETTYI